MIELLAALTASSDLVEQQRCQISDLKDALQARVRARACDSPALQAYTPLLGAGLTRLSSGLHWCVSDWLVTALVYSLSFLAAPIC